MSNTFGVLEQVEQQATFFSVIQTSIEAGKKVMTYIDTEYTTEDKEDGSPVTAADMASHEYICSRLNQLEWLGQKLPIVSEEGADIDYDKRTSWEYLWMIDPIDGTKAFIHKKHGFTINIALIHQGQPIAGVIVDPWKKETFFAAKGLGAFFTPNETIAGVNNLSDLVTKSQKIYHEKSDPSAPKKAYCSEFHYNEETQEYLEKFFNGESFEKNPMSGSLKFCYLAQDQGQIYARVAPVKEWDVACGHIIAEEAGCTVSAKDGSPIKYNAQKFLIPTVLVYRS